MITDRYVSSASGTNTYSQSTNMATPCSLSTAIQFGNSADRFNVRADANYTRAAIDTFSGAANLYGSPIIWRGWKNAPGDGYQGRVNGNGALITTNMPILAYNAALSFSAASGSQIWDSLQISGSRANGALVSMLNTFTNFMQNCTITNSSAINSIGVAPGGGIVNCDVLSTSLTGISIGVDNTATMNRVFGSRIVISSSSTGCIGILCASTTQNILVGNTLIGTSGNGLGIYSPAFTSLLHVYDNTIVGFQDGINLMTGFTSAMIVNNMITDNSGFGINYYTGLGSVAGPIYLSYNRFRNNNSGNYNSAITNMDWFTGDVYNNVIAGTISDYVNFAGQDLRLVSTSPAVGSGLPLYASIGALQLPNTGGSVGGETSSSFI